MSKAKEEKIINTETETRPAIAQMSGYDSPESLEKSLPESTAKNLFGEDSAAPIVKKRGRKPGKKIQPVTMENGDERYNAAVARMSGFGGAQVIKTGFSVTGKPLDDSETTDVDDVFYVLSKNYGLDPSKSAIFMSIYTILLLARMIAVRMMGTTSIDMWSKFDGMFDKKKKETLEQ